MGNSNEVFKWFASGHIMSDGGGEMRSQGPQVLCQHSVKTLCSHGDFGKENWDPESHIERTGIFLGCIKELIHIL